MQWWQFWNGNNYNFRGTPSFTYSWAPTGGNFATAVGLAAGIYTCTITDANGCIVTQTVVITQPTAIVPSPSQVNILCNGGSTGSASVNPSGGNPGYTFSWSPSGGNLATANNLTAGAYSCTITDLIGCVTIQSFSITQPAALTANTLIVAATCGNPNGSATITASGIAWYSYLWSPFEEMPLPLQISQPEIILVPLQMQMVVL